MATLSAALEFVSATDPGRVRSHNEDSIGTDTDIGLAILAELLSGVMSGGCLVSQIGCWMHGPLDAPSRHAAGFVALDLEAICEREAYAAGMNRLVREIHEAPTAAGVERVLLPGEREWARHRAVGDGAIPLPADVREKLAAAAALVGIASPV